MLTNSKSVLAAFVVCFAFPCYAQSAVGHSVAEEEECSFSDGLEHGLRGDQSVALCLGETHIIELADMVTTVVIGDENILTVSPISQRVFAGIPRSPGETSVEFFDADGVLLGRQQFIVGRNFNGSTISASSAPLAALQTTTVEVMVESLGQQMIYRCQGACERMGN